jgi:hypothetical protein
MEYRKGTSGIRWFLFPDDKRHALQAGLEK